MRVFLDFEASSLGEDSYPIEVGWVFEDGQTEVHLIKPAPKWEDWDASAEALHRIGRATLEADGTDHGIVARRILDALAEHKVYASAPSWDGKWLSVLFRGAGLPRHAMRLKDSDEAHLEAAMEALRPAVSPQSLEAAAAGILQRARQAAGSRPASHRALDDAKSERQLWLDVRRLAQEEAASIARRDPA